MATPWNGVLPINESSQDKDEYLQKYLQRKEECRKFHRQSKLECTKVLDDGRALGVVLRKEQHHEDDGIDLWLDTVYNAGEEDPFFDFLNGK